MKGEDLYTTEYFERQTAGRGITREQVNEAYDHSVEQVVQPDGRIRVYGRIPGQQLFMRIVLLPDGETLLNAFFDENYTRKADKGKPR